MFILAGPPKASNQGPSWSVSAELICFESKLHPATASTQCYTATIILL